MIEWDSVADGLRAADALLKAAAVVPRAIRPVTPGRFVAVFSGQVDEIHEALERGRSEAPESVVDHLFLPSPHQDLLLAVGGHPHPVEVDAVGVIETLSLCTLLAAADGTAKEAEVDLLEIRLAMGLGGKAYAVFTGEISDVQAALNRGAEIADGRGFLLRTSLIPRPDPAVVDLLLQPPVPFSDFRID